MYPDVWGSPTGWSTQTGLTPVFGSRSQVAFSTGVQAFSKAHGGRGTIRTVTECLYDGSIDKHKAYGDTA
jgi:hypothetical protein